MDDRERVRALLGREPRGGFEVVVRDAAGDPVVVRNDPLLDDGTPMPTRYWLVGADAVRRVGRLEAAGGVRAAERELDPAAVADAHERYAAERDAALPADHAGPRPSGGVGGTRTGVKCLHAHYAWFLAGGDDPVGRWVAEHLADHLDDHPADDAADDAADDMADGPPVGVTVAVDDAEIRVSGRDGATGSSWSVALPLGVGTLTDTLLAGADPPEPAQLTNAIGAVADHLDDVVREHPELLELDSVAFTGPPARTIAQVEVGAEAVPNPFTLERDAAEDVFRTVATERRRDRAHNPGLPAEHVDTVVAAACVVVAVMRRLHLPRATIVG